MRERERRRVEGEATGHGARGVFRPEHPLLHLQRAAGNAAVAGLLAGTVVQRIWPFDEEEDEEIPRNPSGEIPNEPTAEPEEEPGGMVEDLPDPKSFAVWQAVLSRSGWGVGMGLPIGRERSVMVESSRAVAMEFARSLPPAPIPDDLFAHGQVMMDHLAANATDVVLKPSLGFMGEVYRKWVGLSSPEVDRITGGAAGPDAGRAAGGAGAAGGGGIPGLEPAQPGGPAGGGDIPGMAPVSPGTAVPGGMPGLEPVPPGGVGGPGETSSRPMLRRGSSGDAVRKAQTLLVRHGAALIADGQFGSLTRTAVIDFQRNAGLSPDGIVGPLTWQALEST